ncbi:amylo-alpha-1,6-glucosidase [Actinoplanes sp. M2I2]|uniref:amylo-alpha-1,6-glucosidase n=1 Tax=Actinoplanes sp. M2I2 TaxID=1734444 RepID=UPI002020E461|nr:amylo-alpha-1,6-glucosidase [Actinoplanes sp. M2I2]
MTDGLGGFATGTVPGLRTRRYHSLLTLAAVPGSGDATGERRLALAALDLTVTLPTGAKVPLFTHEWESRALVPRGDRHLETFALIDGVPRWRWRIGGVVIERELAMRHGHPGVAVTHRVVSAAEPVGLAVAAMCTWRDAHDLRRAGSGPLRVEQVAGGVIVEDAYRIAGPGWQAGGEWHLGAYAREEAARGLPAVEDLWHAGTYFEQVSPGGVMEISAWAGELTERPVPATSVITAARARSRELVAAAKAEGSVETLVLAADAFVVHGADGPDVVAGYPWFGSYLGDTMTSYEGLFLDTGRVEEGRELLLAHTVSAAEQIAEPGGPWAPRSSPDAPLWLAHAIDRHVRRTGDTDLAAELVDPLGRLLRRHLDVDPADGLVRLGTAATWMNGYTEDGLVTPRIGKPVEINALWVNALAVLAGLTAEAGRDDAGPRAGHDRARASFRARFPAPEGWLYDVIDGPAATYPLGAGSRHDDPSLRPNQLLAWSLPHAPLDEGVAALHRIGDALLTPLGLRTLAPTEYGYQGEHRGDRDERDIAYHQGTVWPWLIGPYADACAALGRPTDDLLDGLEAHLREWGAGSVSETADGDPPHRAGGSPFSARSVAELLRVLRKA